MPHVHNNREKNQKFLVFSFSTSLFLFLGKSILGFFSGSSSLLASSIDSLMDSVSTLINMLFLKQSLEPADKEHPFGHGKFEAFSGLIQGLVITILSLSLLLYSVIDFFQEDSQILHLSEGVDQKSFEFWGIIVVIISIIAPLVLSYYMKKQAEKTHSLVLEAEHSHFFADGIMNGGVLLGLLISYFYSTTWVDGVIGILISLWLIWGIKDLLKESFNVLVDTELPEEIQKDIEKILDISVKNSEISGWHAMRTRRSGMEYHIDFHLEFSGDLSCISLKDAHDRSHIIEKSIRESFPNAIILTHLDYENDL